MSVADRCPVLRQMTTEIDSLVIGAKSVPELYRKLNTLDCNGSKDWQLLRQPTWVGKTLIAVVIKWDNDPYSEE